MIGLTSQRQKYVFFDKLTQLKPKTVMKHFQNNPATLNYSIYLRTPNKTQIGK